jgi:hypothetical protein
MRFWPWRKDTARTAPAAGLSPGSATGIDARAIVASGDIAGIASTGEHATNVEYEVHQTALTALPGGFANAGFVAGDVTIHAGPVVRSAYREQVRRIAPDRLADRDAELVELAAFCTEPDRGPYAWWRGPESIILGHSHRRNR